MSHIKIACKTLGTSKQVLHTFLTAHSFPAASTRVLLDGTLATMNWFLSTREKKGKKSDCSCLCELLPKVGGVLLLQLELLLDFFRALLSVVQGHGMLGNGQRRFRK